VEKRTVGEMARQLLVQSEDNQEKGKSALEPAINVLGFGQNLSY